jgi:hypothetical protein
MKKALEKAAMIHGKGFDARQATANIIAEVLQIRANSTMPGEPPPDLQTVQAEVEQMMQTIMSNALPDIGVYQNLYNAALQAGRLPSGLADVPREQWETWASWRMSDPDRYEKLIDKLDQVLNPARMRQ